jgi:hypothetical protein
MLRAKVDGIEGANPRGNSDGEEENIMFLNHVTLETKSAFSNIISPKNDEIQ